MKVKKVLVSELAEPLTKWYADIVGLPNAEVAKEFVDVGLFEGIDFANNVLFQDLGAKIIGFIEGVAFHAVAGRVPQLAGRNKEDLQLIGSCLMWNLADPKPEDLVKLANLVASIKSGVQFGSWAPLAGALGIKSPDQVKRDFDNVVASFQRAFGLPTIGAPLPPPGAPPPYAPPPRAEPVIQFG